MPGGLWEVPGIEIPPMPFELREYQSAAIAAVYSWFEKHEGHPLIVLPTGSGKSIVQAALIRDIWSHSNGERILCLTHVRELIAQNHAALLKIWPDAPAGIYSAGIGKRDKTSPIIFGGIQSLHTKAALMQWADIVIVDESHLIPRKGEGMYLRFITDMLAINPKMKLIGLTATPFRTDSGSLHEGEGRLFDGIAYEAELTPLIEQGFLSQMRTKATTSEIDTSGVHRRGGEFIERELEMAAMEGANVERAVQEIVDRSDGRNSWLIFCCGVEHAGAVVAELRGYDPPIECAVVLGSTPKDERDQVLADFKAGKLQCVVNVNVLTTGFDAPGVDLIAMLRPTLSPVLYVQMVGRGLRIAPGKTDCLVLDFGGNVRRHGPLTHVKPQKPKSGEEGGAAPIKTCPTCQEINHAAVRSCQACGFVFPAPLVKHDETPDEKVEIIKPTRPVIERCHVSQSLYLRHEKEGKTRSLRALYEIGFRKLVSEWVCFEHDGYARVKAVSWWRERGGDMPAPATVDEALVRIESGEITNPCSVTVNTAGDWPKLLSVRLDRIPGEDDGEDDDENAPSDYDNSDLPF